MDPLRKMTKIKKSKRNKNNCRWKNKRLKYMNYRQKIKFNSFKIVFESKQCMSYK